MMARAVEPVVRGRSQIAASLSDVLGYLPSDDQIKSWMARKTNPLPFWRDAGKPACSPSALQTWARTLRAPGTVKPPG